MQVTAYDLFLEFSISYFWTGVDCGKLKPQKSKLQIRGDCSKGQEVERMCLSWRYRKDGYLLHMDGRQLKQQKRVRLRKEKEEWGGGQDRALRSCKRKRNLQRRGQKGRWRKTRSIVLEKPLEEAPTNRILVSGTGWCTAGHWKVSIELNNKKVIGYFGKMSLACREKPVILQGQLPHLPPVTPTPHLPLCLFFQCYLSLQAML